MDSPLVSKRVVVTRPANQAMSFCEQLMALGARPIRFPTIRLEPVRDVIQLKRALSSLSDYDRVIFTSVNGVRFTWAALQTPWPDNLRTVAIGPATAEALRQRGVEPEFVPEEFTAERIAVGLDSVTGQKILLLRAQKANPVLADVLRARQADVTEVAAYRTLMNTPDQSAFAALIAGFDVLTFTSSSTVEGFAAVGKQPPDHVVIACIGPVTASTARRTGYRVDVIAREYTTGGLIQSLIDHFTDVR